MLVVTVHFTLVPGAEQAFRAAILQNAASSLREPGCRQFDVAFTPDERRCFLYELYDDAAAFDAHHETPHFKHFATVSGPMVSEKRLETFVLAPNPLVG
jgi:(4S)-4-hydroxy-5-phosphonooxypentane-2,3-dione isomerase